jgi:Zn-dependent peptidase ImmA (M78 family)
MPYAKSMKDLYERLKDVGFDANFVRYRILPDWWEDDLASTASNRALAEAAISRMLRFPIAQLRNPNFALKLPQVGNVRLKRNIGTEAKDVLPAILLAEQTANSLLTALTSIVPFPGPVSAEQVRKTILAERRFVDLGGLLQFAWQSGIVVLHLAELPKATKKLSGMAMFCGETPVIVLACGRDSPPWVAFHLAHELGHILLGHVAVGSSPLADGDIDQLDQDADETAADEFACEVLTGSASLDADAIYGLTAQKLVQKARDVAARRSIDPGTVALVYGRNANRIPVAQNALKIMGLDHGAHAKIGAALTAHLQRDDLSESTERFLSLLSVT